MYRNHSTVLGVEWQSGDPFLHSKFKPKARKFTTPGGQPRQNHMLLPTGIGSAAHQTWAPLCDVLFCMGWYVTSSQVEPQLKVLRLRRGDVMLPEPSAHEEEHALHTVDHAEHGDEEEPDAGHEPQVLVALLLVVELRDHHDREAAHQREPGADRELRDGALRLYNVFDNSNINNSRQSNHF